MSVRFGGTARMPEDRPSLAGVPGLMTIGLDSGTAGPRRGGFRTERDAVGRPMGIDKPVDPLPRTRRTGHDLREAMESRRMAESLVPQSLAGETMASAAAASGIGGPIRASGEAGAEAAIPEHVRMTGQMLHFKAYFNESIVESPSESFRTRVIILRYFLEDDTFEAFEERQRNDGMAGVKFLRRMQHPGVSIESLRVGTTLTLYAKTLKIFACDEFTRHYYDERGTPQPRDTDRPEDPFTASVRATSTRGDFFGKKINAVSRYVEAVRGAQVRKKDTLGKFLTYGDEALRFKVMWDNNSASDTGDKQYFMLTFYLSSDEADVKRLRGYGEYPGMNTLLTRRKLPKKLIAHDDRERSAEDGTGDEDYYHPEDFRVGETVYVYGRNMLIFDCDEYTRHWYLDHMGIDQGSRSVDVSEPVKPKPKLPVPPPTGFGSEEDSLQSWRYLDPRKKPIKQPAVHDDLEGKTLQFMANLVSDDPIDSSRKFRITWYLYDETLAVYEPPQPNSGITGGKFQARQRTTNVETGENFKATDFYVGAQVIIKGHRFEIYQADDFSLRHMESNSRLWPMASFEYVISNLKQKLGEKSSSLRKMFRKFDLDKSQTISIDEFRSMLEYYGMKISHQEAITIYRHFDADRTGLLDYGEFVKAFTTRDEEGGVAGARGPGRQELEAERKRIEEEEEAEAAEGGGYAATVDEVSRREREEKHTEELLARLSRKIKGTASAQMVHQRFRDMDLDKDHMLSKEEFHQVFGSLGFNLSEHDIELLAKKFFDDEQEEIDYNRVMGLIHTYADKVVRS